MRPKLPLQGEPAVQKLRARSELSFPEPTRSGRLTADSRFNHSPGSVRFTVREYRGRLTPPCWLCLPAVTHGDPSSLLTFWRPDCVAAHDRIFWLVEWFRWGFNPLCSVVRRCPEVASSAGRWSSWPASKKTASTRSREVRVVCEDTEFSGGKSSGQILSGEWLLQTDWDLFRLCRLRAFWGTDTSSAPQNKTITCRVVQTGGTGCFDPEPRTGYTHIMCCLWFKL